MTTYNAISDSTVQLDKPANEQLFRQLRDNPLAIAEGDASAPRVQPKALDFPYFKAVRGTNQNVTTNTAAWVKLQANTEIFDPDGVYDATTNYRFHPTKAGVYLCRVSIQIINGQSAALNYRAGIGKNGSPSVAHADYTQAYKSGHADGNDTQITHERLVQMNGTTDYVEAYWAQVGGGNNTYDVQGVFWAIAMCES